MRKITKLAVDAFFGREQFKLSNTEVTSGDRADFMYLHRNIIAIRTEEGLFVSHCGWCTPTTRERLNGVVNDWNVDLHVRVRQGEMQVVDQGGEVVMLITEDMEKLNED